MSLQRKDVVGVDPLVAAVYASERYSKAAARRLLFPDLPGRAGIASLPRLEGPIPPRNPSDAV